MRTPLHTTAALAVSAAILVGSAVCLIWLPWDLEKAVRQHALQYPIPVSFHATFRFAPVNLSALRSAPLFYRSRQSVDDAEIVAAAPPQYVLLAALTGPPGKSVAYVRPMDGRDAVRVREGEAIQSWVVKSIQLRRVTLQRRGQTAEIVAAPHPDNVGLTRVPVAGAVPHVASSHVLGSSGVNASHPPSFSATPSKNP